MNHRKKKRFERTGGLALCLCILLSCLPISALAVTEDGLCEHHPAHTEECGYVAAAEEHPCTHEHTDDCYFLIKCIHEHNEDCQETCAHECREESGCITVQHNCHHSHDESCGYSDGELASACTHECGEECTEGCIHEHDDICGYAEEVDATPCNHVCSIEDGCYELICSHVTAGQHDHICGYVEAKEGQPCGFVCEECAAAPELPAEEEQLEKNESEQWLYAENSVAETDSEPETVSVSITWGAMDFTYTDGDWNTETHTYDEGGWTASGNTVNVTNTGTEPVQAMVGYENANGYSFAAKWSMKTAEISGGMDYTFTMNLSGKPASTLSNTTIGTVTVTLTDADTPIGWVEESGFMKMVNRLWINPKPLTA